MAVWKDDKSLQPNLETQSWKNLNINGYSFFVKGLFIDKCYEILITDLSSIWEESISEGDILKRSKSINPVVEAPLEILLSHLSNILLQSPQPLCSYQCQCSEDSLVVSVEGPLQDSLGPHYQWNFTLRKAPPLLLKNHLVCPLLSSTVELLHRHEELVKIIQRKDREINDYKESGAVVSRKHLQTAPFDKMTFQNDMIKKKVFKDYSLNPTEYVGSDWESLYHDIVTCRHWYNNATTTSQDEVTPEQSPIKSSMKSPMKRSIEESPSKDIEKIRRLELEKKLEDSKTKVKKKKKKLM